MPIYEYRCEACEHELEALQKMSDPALSECPECKRDSLKKVISAAAFRLKGSGWYETDFKRGSKKNIHDNGGNEAKTEAKTTKTESKPASCSGGSCGCH
ncbi:MAG: zinc ribbon domain-containing protein [Candidatus Thiodiazotropha sp.]